MQSNKWLKKLQEKESGGFGSFGKSSLPKITNDKTLMDKGSDSFVSFGGFVSNGSNPPRTPFLNKVVYTSKSIDRLKNDNLSTHKSTAKTAKTKNSIKTVSSSGKFTKDAIDSTAKTSKTETIDGQVVRFPMNLEHHAINRL